MVYQGLLQAGLVDDPGFILRSPMRRPSLYHWLHGGIPARLNSTSPAIDYPSGASYINISNGDARSHRLCAIDEVEGGAKSANEGVGVKKAQCRRARCLIC